jgi:hypothetical protein
MGRDRRETSVTPAEPDGQTGAVAGRQIQRLVSGLVPRTCGASMEAESHT